MSENENYEPDIISVTDDYEVIILKVAEENGDEYLEEIEDEAEYNEISEILMNKIEQQYDVEYYDPTEQ